MSPTEKQRKEEEERLKHDEEQMMKGVEMMRKALEYGKPSKITINCNGTEFSRINLELSDLKPEDIEFKHRDDERLLATNFKKVVKNKS